VAEIVNNLPAMQKTQVLSPRSFGEGNGNALQYGKQYGGSLEN